MPASKPLRAHLITGGFPPGTPSGHDHDYVRLRLLHMLDDVHVPCSVANDFADIDRWLATSRLLITYVAGPYPNDDQDHLIREWLTGGGRWLGLHGTSGGRARRLENGERRMVKTSHHATFGSFFLNHPPIRQFRVEVGDCDAVLTRGLPRSFEVTDELYIIELQDPATTRVLLSTIDLPVDTSPAGFGFTYDRDTSLQPDGKTRVLGYTRAVGAGGVTYVSLGHCGVARPGDAAPPPRCSWESPVFETLLRNAIEWGLSE